MPPSNAESAPIDPHDSTKPIEMPKFRWSPPPADPTVRRAPASVPANDNRVRPLPKKQESKSSSLQSLLPRVQELNKRRMLLQEEREQREPSTLQAESIAMQAESVAAETSPVPIETPEPQQIGVEKTLVSGPADTIPEVPHSATQLKLRSQQFLRETRTRLVQAYQSLASAWQWMSQQTTKVAANFAGLNKRIRSASETAILAKKIRWANRIPKTSGNTASELQIVKPTAPGATSQPTTHAFGTNARLRVLTVTRSAQQFWERRVLIRVRAGKHLRNAIVKVEATRAQAAALRKNRRLANSMLMAALSALLALGLVLVVKRYAPIEATVVKSPVHPAVASVNSSAVSPKPAVNDAVAKPVVAKQIVATSLITPMAVAKPTAQKVVTHKAILRRTHRQGNDDDYVAPDTYVYYGHR